MASHRQSLQARFIEQQRQIHIMSSWLIKCVTCWIGWDFFLLSGIWVVSEDYVGYCFTCKYNLIKSSCTGDTLVTSSLYTEIPCKKQMEQLCASGCGMLMGFGHKISWTFMTPRMLEDSYGNRIHPAPSEVGMFIKSLSQSVHPCTTASQNLLVEL